MPKRERPDLNKDWPRQTRQHYIKLFDLQERLRARLKLAQELAVHNLVVNGNLSNPDEAPGYVRGRTKSNPIPVVGKHQPEDYLKKYQDEQLPYIRYYLSRMQGEIEKIKRAFVSGRRPNWYKQIVKVEDLAVEIWEAMDEIQGHFLLTLKFNNRALRDSNQVIIDATKLVIETALKIRSELLFLMPDLTAVGPDKFGIFDTVIDSDPEPEPQEFFMDLTTFAIWQQDQHRKKQG